MLSGRSSTPSSRQHWPSHQDTHYLTGYKTYRRHTQVARGDPHQVTPSPNTLSPVRHRPGPAAHAGLLAPHGPSQVLFPSVSHQCLTPDSVHTPDYTSEVCGDLLEMVFSKACCSESGEPRLGFYDVGPGAPQVSDCRSVQSSGTFPALSTWLPGGLIFGGSMIYSHLRCGFLVLTPEDPGTRWSRPIKICSGSVGGRSRSPGQPCSVPAPSSQTPTSTASSSSCPSSRHWSLSSASRMAVTSAMASGLKQVMF